MDHIRGGESKGQRITSVFNWNYLFVCDFVSLVTG